MIIKNVVELNALIKLFKYLKFESTDADTVFYSSSTVLNEVMYKTIVSLHNELGQSLPKWGYIEDKQYHILVIEQKLKNYYLNNSIDDSVVQVIKNCIYPYQYQEATIEMLLNKIMEKN